MKDPDESSGEAFDLFVKDLFGQKAGHLCVVPDQSELRVDRAVQGFSKRLGTTGLSGWVSSASVLR